jgi:acyl CoA:acetate/3-ketoacid CoA transferase
MTPLDAAVDEAAVAIEATDLAPVAEDVAVAHRAAIAEPAAGITKAGPGRNVEVAHACARRRVENASAVTATKSGTAAAIATTAPKDGTAATAPAARVQVAHGRSTTTGAAASAQLIGLRQLDAGGNGRLCRGGLRQRARRGAGLSCNRRERECGKTG